MATVTLNISDREMQVVNELAAQKNLSKTALIRQALRLYQWIDSRLCAGETLAFKDANGNVIEQAMVGCGGHDEY